MQNMYAYTVDYFSWCITHILKSPKNLVSQDENYLLLINQLNF